LHARDWQREWVIEMPQGQDTENRISEKTQIPQAP
jgi:hypothetical protein